MVDLGERAAGAAGPTADDFAFKVGTGGDPAAWAAAAARPDIAFRPRAGGRLADRVTLTFPDGAIRNTWLEVTVLPGERTGLLAPQTFYFGNLVGDTGEGDTGDGTATLRVNALDLGAMKRELNRASDLTGRFDFNRDGKVNALDLGIVRSNLNRSLAAAAPPVAAPPVVVAPLFRSAPAVDLRADSGPATRPLWDDMPPTLP
jgi:hypothetical protein